MRIVLVLEHLDPRRGGCEVYTCQVAGEMAKRGHEVAVLCQDSAWEHPGVAVRPLGRRGATRAARLRNFVADAQQALMREKPDVSHAMLPVPRADIYQPHGGTAPARALAGLRRRRGLGRVVARLARALNPSRRLVARLERQVVADPRTLCLAVSEMVGEEFRRYYGRGENVRVVFNGAEWPQAGDDLRREWRRQRRAELGAADGEPVFLMVGRNFELKGVPQAIAAFGAWLRRGPSGRTGRLVVVGRESPSRAARLARHQGVAGRAHFIPPTREIHEWYAAADVCLVLSWYESCSLVLLEATASGVPTIATACVGAAGILRDGAGLVVPAPDDLAAIVAAMDRLSRPAERAAAAEACRRAAPGLTLSRHVDELLAVYKEVTAR